MGHSTTWLEFIRDRDELLRFKPGQTVRGVAEDLVRLMELLAIHGSTGMDGEAEKQGAYIRGLEGRIWAAARAE